jgi:hypothetical protein
MPVPVTITVSIRKITALQLGAADAEAFAAMVPSGQHEYIDVEHDATGLLPKEQKELTSFCEFARRSEFQSTIRRLLGTEPGSVFQIDVLSSARGEDPPDMILRVGAGLGIEVTDFPPDQAALAQAMAEVAGPSPLPAFHEGGCSPELIKQFMRKPVSMTEPHFGDLASEVEALCDYAALLLRQKDDTGRSQLLLLNGLMAFDVPNADVIDYLVRTRCFSTIRCVVFITSSAAHVYWTNRM